MKTKINHLLGAGLTLLGVGTYNPTFLLAADCVPVPPDAVASWRAEGNALDNVSGNHGIPVGGMGFAPGIVGQAFSFDGVDDYVEVPQSADLTITSVITIEFWAKRQQLGRIDAVLAKGDWSADDINYGVGLNDNEFYFFFGGFGIRRAARSIDLNWHHYAVVAMNGQTSADMFIDGVAVSPGNSDGATIQLNPTTQSLKLGRQDGSTIYYGSVLLDELSIYNRALTAAEVQSIYAAGSAGKCVPPPACASVPDGAVAWYRAEGNALDSQSANHGTLQNGTAFAAGVAGQAFSFDGVDDYVQIADSSSLKGFANVSFEMWVHPNALAIDGYCNGGACDILLLKEFTYLIAIRADGRIETSFGNGTDWGLVTYTVSTGAITVGMWNHLAVVKDGTTVSYYINGTLAGIATDSEVVLGTANTDPLVIGANNKCCPPGSFTSFFNGLIDELAIYNRALNAAEVQSIYAAGSAGKCVPPPVCASVPDGAVAWYRAENNGMDSAGANHGTLHNGMVFAAGEVGQAFGFDGVNDYMEVPDHPSLRIGDFISIEFWAKRQRFGVDVVVEKNGDWNTGVGDPGANYGVGLHEVNNNMFYFYFRGGWRGSDGVSDLEWHHYAIVAIQGQANPTFYIDGVERASLYAGGVGSIDLNAASTLPLYIGAQANDPQGYNYYGNNIIDELAIFHGALTATEVQSIYAAGSAGKCASSATCAPVPAGPVAWWRAEQNGLDSVDSHHGSLQNGLDFAPARVGSGFNYVADNQELLVAAGGTLDVGPGAGFTIECWINPADTANPSPLVEWHGADPAQQGGLHLWINFAATCPGSCDFSISPGAIYANLQVGPDQHFTLNSAPSLLHAGEWQHVALTYSKESGAAQIFLNGAEVASRQLGVLNPSTSSLLHLGYRPGSVTYHGLLDEVAIYSRALSAAELQAIYAAGSAGKCVPTDNQPPVARCQNVTISANANCQAEVTAAQVDNGSFDPDGDSLTMTLDPAGPYSLGTTAVTLTVDDGKGASSFCEATITVVNSAPIITSVTGPAGPMALGNAVSVTVQFTDVDSNQPHICVFNWDDGSSESITVAAGIGTATKTHTYTAAGVYTVNVTVSDPCTSVSTEFQFAVIYDPSGGFVTGGGWISSPAGAYLADTTLSGKANFGFVSKYKKGAAEPDGETEFQFQTGAFNFHSVSYDWLVVSGAKAQYKGTGTVNGGGDYGFLLTATDGQVTGGGGADKFRIKVWVKATGATVYDNVPGAPDTLDGANPQVIANGSIVIHK